MHTLVCCDMKASLAYHHGHIYIYIVVVVVVVIFHCFFFHVLLSTIAFDQSWFLSLY